MTKAIVHEVYIVWRITWKLVNTGIDGSTHFVGVDDPKELWDIYIDPDLAQAECIRAKKDDEESGLMFSRYEVTAHTVKSELGEN